MSLLQRLRNAGQALIGREERSPSHEFTEFFRSIGQTHTFKPEASLKAYGDNPWLYSAVNSVCSEVSRIDLKLEVKKGDQWETVEKHQAIETLNRPCPGAEGKSHLTRRQLIYLVGQHKLLNGEAFWLLDRRLKVNGAPTKIEPLMPGDIKLHLSKENDISHYSYGLKDVRLEPEDVVHFKAMNPENWFRGHAPTKSIRFALDTQFESDVLNLNKIKNDAVPAGILKSDQKIPDTERKKILQAWKSMYGGSKNSGKTAFMPNGVDFTKIQESNSDMQFIEGKEWTRDEILANFRIGLEMLGRTESQTRANADAAIYVFAKFVVLPMMEMITDTLSSEYLTQFPGTEGMRFSFPDPVPENVEEKRENAKVLMEAGALTPDEMREMFDLAPLEQKGVTDVPYINFNKLPSTAPPLAAA